ncbi:MAG TPA: hypothetical protein VHK88_01210 [Aquihabitans sp.]|jgi:hypothetical protein|nr:hypothetical protein [Aquihabitans sp.]
MARSPKQKRPATWIEVAVGNGGFRKALKALAWAHSWIYVQVALGRDPSVDEVAEWWNESRRTAFREQAAFRECFPHLDSPAAIYERPGMREQIEDSVAQLAKVEAAVRRLRRSKDTDLLDTGLLSPGA